MKYEDFVKSLIKPGVTLEKEITPLEESIVDSVFQLTEKANDVRYICYDECINLFNFLDKKDVLELKHMLIGLVGESGELIDPIKRMVIYRKSITDIVNGQSLYDNIIEEIGDLYFYSIGIKIIHDRLLKMPQFKEEYTIEPIRNAIQLFIESINDLIELLNKYINYKCYAISLNECIRLNQVKLEKRYNQGNYSDKQATERADKEDIDKLALIIKRKLDENYPTCGDGVWGLPYIKDVMQGKKINNNDEKVLSFYNNLK